MPNKSCRAKNYLKQFWEAVFAFSVVQNAQQVFVFDNLWLILKKLTRVLWLDTNVIAGKVVFFYLYPGTRLKKWKYFYLHIKLIFTPVPYPCD